MNLRVNDWNFRDSIRRHESNKASAADWLRLHPAAIVALAVTACAALGTLELRSSLVESLVLSAVARRVTFKLATGPSGALSRRGRGPYDHRLGIAELPDFVRRLEAEHFRVDAQARISRAASALARVGAFAAYHEKDQAGLQIMDRTGKTLYRAAYPRHIYPDFQSIPPLIVNTLLFIESREMLDAGNPFHNTAVQWSRMSRAVADLAIHAVDHRRTLIGGSTLATQLEKIRHSPGGRTRSILEKGRQMLSASIRAYQEGPRTLRAQQEVVCDYLNSIPLAAIEEHGEVIGLADGLADWFGVNVDSVNRLLSVPETSMNRRTLASRATAYREVVSLLLALRQPSRDLAARPDLLTVKVNRYLRALCHNGIISPHLRDLALAARIHLRTTAPPAPSEDFVANKAPNAIRMRLLRLLGLDNAYALDRLDLTANTTLDRAAEQSVSAFLMSLSSARAVKAFGLDQYQLLDRGNPKGVIYSVTLYERSQGANLLRLQTDNYDQPLDISQQTKMQLGSTAKLRTLILYLEIVQEIHKRYAALAPSVLQNVPVTPGDNLTKWGIGYLCAAKDRRLEPMLVAALQRKYSASPGEAFFTAGGLHRFANFEHSEDSRIMTVSEGFQQSVNLVFIRLMRDIERYYMFREPGARPSLLTDPDDPARRGYLERFADYEGRMFLSRFYRKYRNQTAGVALETLAAHTHLTPLRAAVIYRSVRPQAGLGEFTAFLQAHLPRPVLAAQDLPKLFDKYGPDKFDLNDRGYLAHVNPLELWLLNYREGHPSATIAEIFAASAAQRQLVYQWLFKTRYKHAQDRRIETLLEIDAFKPIYRAWKRLGYPFDSLVPSYATSIGVSGDTPQALAELIGILLNDGKLYPSISIDRLQFESATPYETILSRPPAPGVQVLSPVIAALVRKEMIGVVENGTGRRVRGGVRLLNRAVLPVGGKTGTGDNCFELFGSRGVLIGSRVVNRTAAFVFFIGSRFYGTVLAFVPGRSAANYNFTSALAVQVLKDLEPSLLPVLSSPRRNQETGSAPGLAKTPDARSYAGRPRPV